MEKKEANFGKKNNFLIRKLTFVYYLKICQVGHKVRQIRTNISELAEFLKNVFFF